MSGTRVSAAEAIICQDPSGRLRFVVRMSAGAGVVESISFMGKRKPKSARKHKRLAKAMERRNKC